MSACYWQCGDRTPKHAHYAVLVRDDGKLLGRLCPDGTTARNVVHAAVLSQTRATDIAESISGQPNKLRAVAIPF